jgi:MoaA/NifB/PqqE/SkfB family radical SAM enzyme
MTEIHLLSTARARAPSRLDDALPPPHPADPPVAALVAAVAGVGEPVWLAGGEPTLRADLPELCAAVAAPHGGVGLLTDGLALARADAAGRLVEAGVRRVRVALHSGRPDAHDWLVRQPGATRLAVKALRTLRDLGVATEIAATVTRPTAAHLGELVELGAHLGVRAVHLRRMTAVTEDAVMLAPRLALLEPELGAAARAAAAGAVRLWVHGVPRCRAGEARACVAGPHTVRRLAAADPAWQALAASLAGPAAGGCSTCPGAPECAGAPADYVARFGWEELVAPAERAPEVVVVRFAGPSRVACPVCGDAGVEPSEPEPTRGARLRLTRAARQGARVLRIASAASLAHPAAADLLREATLLAFERVEVAGEASAVAEWSDADMYQLRGITRLDAAFYGPTAAEHDEHVGRAGAFAATLAGLQRLRAVAGTEVGGFAVVHDPAALGAFSRAWGNGRLPGEPRFRLSPLGGSLAALGRAAEAMDAAAQAALAEVLPPCRLQGSNGGARAAREHAFGDFLVAEWPRSGSDLRGMFRECGCEAAMRARCPGRALGWNDDP